MEGFLKMHSSRKYPYNPRKGIGIFSGWVGSLRPKYLKKCIKVISISQAGGIPSVFDVWIFCGNG